MIEIERELGIFQRRDIDFENCLGTRRIVRLKRKKVREIVGTVKLEKLQGNG